MDKPIEWHEKSLALFRRTATEKAAFITKQQNDLEAYQAKLDRYEHQIAAAKAAGLQTFERDQESY